MRSSTSSASSLFFLAFAALTTARTDLTGCTSSEVIVDGGASLLFYVPGTGEICAFLDCGGGTAPPKTSVPGCPLYSGTATVTPSFLPNFGQAAATTPVGLPATQTSPPPSITPASTGLVTAMGTGTSTLEETILTDTGLVMATGSPSASGSDNVDSVMAAGTATTASSSSVTSASASTSANVAVGARQAGGLAGLAAVMAVLL